MTLIGVSLFTWDKSFLEWLSDRAGGHADDSFGAILIIMGTKWFYERGKHPSQESK